MARKLMLFHDVTINSGRDSHIVFNDFASFFAIMNNNFGERIIDYDNYRINTGTIKISLENLTLNNLSKITYAIEYEVNYTAFNYYRCYFIKGYDLVSGYVVFYVEQDRWANNIAKANIFDLEVFRSNRLLGDGIFDEVKYTKGAYNEDFYDYQQIEQGEKVLLTTRVCIAFLMQFNISQQVFGTKKTTRTLMFITDSAHDVYLDEKANIQTAFEKESYLQLLADAVGTITGVSGNLGSLDAQVLKAWVVDSQKIDISSTAYYLQASCKYGGHQTTIKAWHLDPIQVSETYTLENITPNKVYYIGSYLNGFKLLPYCNKGTNGYELSFNLDYIVDDNEVKIIASQGERIKDITNMFELFLTTNDANETAIRYIARCFNASMGAVNSTFGGAKKGMEMGGPVMSGVMGTLSFANSALSMVNAQPSFENAIGGGDGLRTFYLSPSLDAQGQNEMAEYVKSPYVLITYDSARDEEENANIYGVNYRKFINSLGDLLNDSNYAKINANYRDFLQCECEVSNVESEDANFIANELRRGIFIDIVNEN